MQGSPSSSRNKAEKEEEEGILYSQQTIVFDQEPRPINGDLLEDVYHRSLGALIFFNKNKKSLHGTAVLLSENVILTAAHNVFDKVRNHQNTGFKFYIGADGEAEDYHEIEDWRYPDEYKTCKPSARLAFDYAVMKLKNPIKFDKYLPLSQACADCLMINSEQLILEIYGFPSAYPPDAFGNNRPFKNNYMPVNLHDKYSQKFMLNQYGLAHKDKIIEVNAQQLKICYGLSTLPGQSGSPVVIDNTIIAVHVGGEINKEFNVGRIIDTILINNITEWGKQLKAAPFSLEGEIMCPHNKQKQLNLKGQQLVNQKQLPKNNLEAVPSLSTKKQLVINQQKQISRKTQITAQKKEKHDEGQMYSEENIFYEELPFRIEGQQLKQILHRSVVALTFLNLHKKIGAGSGVLISKDIILTAAHNIYQRDKRSRNSCFKVYIGANGVGEEHHEVEEWRYNPEYETCPVQKKGLFDYAIMKLKKPVQFQQFPSLSIACHECLLQDNESINLKVVGYPRAYPPDSQGNARPFEDNFKSLDLNGQKIRLYQYGLARKGRIVVINAIQLKIGYGISTLPGQSGSPVVVGNTIIGVHVGGEVGKEFNVGRIVDQTLVKNVAEWAKQVRAASFSSEGPAKCKHSQQNAQNLQQLMSNKTNPKTKLQLRSRQLKSVDLREYANLLELNLQKNELQQIDLAHCPRLTKINLSSNQLQQIDTSKNTNLTQLYLSYNKLQKMDVSANTNLTYLSLDYNKLQKMDVSANTNLTWLDLSSNKLQKMDVSANTNLTQLYLSYNKLQKMDVSANTNLTRLYLHFNKLIEIDLTKSTKLQKLWLENNRLSLVRLWIAEDVEEWKYNNYFDFSDQESAACRVQLKCKGAAKQKATRVAEKWKE